MPRYLSLHTLACMTRQGAEALLKALAADPGAVVLRRTSWNFLEGRMLAEFEAPDRETAERWLAQKGMRPQWLMRIEYESNDGDLKAVRAAEERTSLPLSAKQTMGKARIYT